MGRAGRGGQRQELVVINICEPPTVCRAWGNVGAMAEKVDKLGLCVSQRETTVPLAPSHTLPIPCAEWVLASWGSQLPIL